MKRVFKALVHSFMAIDPDCFIGRDKFKREMDLYIKGIKDSAKAKNCSEILMPGEPELKTETERLKEGIRLAKASYERVGGPW